MSTIDLIDTVLVTGGSGGIGRALAEFLIKQGKKVIIAGRTEETLKSTAKEIGASAYYVLDTSKTRDIVDIVPKITSAHPDLNCLVNNAGVQRPFQFPGSGGKDYEFDLTKADQEIDTNIRGPMYLCVTLLPHFTSLEKKSVIINVSSVLGFSPSSIINPVYNGTKAWIHMFTMNLRTQFANGPSKDKLKVIELVPPQVATDLHRERVDPDDNKKEKSKASLSLEEFMDEVARKLEQGDEIITAGPGNKLVETWENSLGDLYQKAVSS